MVKAVVTDFDGVIRHWQQHKIQKVELDCKLEPGTLTRIRKQEDLIIPALTGKITFARWAELVRERLIKKYGLGVAEHYLRAWQSRDVVIDYPLIQAYRELFPQARLVLATNATNRLPQELKEQGLSHSFDVIFNSSAMGVAKPAKQYFQAMLISMGLTAKDVLFIDDRPENIQAAKALGIQSFLYNGRDELIHQLTAISLENCLVEV